MIDPSYAAVSLTTPLSLLIPLFRTHAVQIGAPPDNVRSSPPPSRSTTLIPSSKSLVPCKVTFSEGLGTGHPQCWGAVVLPSTLSTKSHLKTLGL